MLKVTVTFLLLSICIDCFACDCVRVADEKADLVFEGTAKSVQRWHREPRDDGGFFSKMNRISFDVDKISKGPKLKSIVIDTPTNDCGLQSIVGRKYRVFAQYKVEEGLQWYADQCGSTRPVAGKERAPKGRAH
jgi:hypothetical protein